MHILGISAYYHDSAAALITDGEIVAAAQEERFTRKKHDHNFPSHAVNYCLQEAGLKPGDLECVVFYDKPFVKFERILETYFGTSPFGIRSFLKAMPLWLKKKLWLPDIIAEDLGYEGPVLFAEHHESHAASAYYPSPFDEAAVLTIDGVGEWATNTIGSGSGTGLEILEEITFPHSLGLLYSAFTHFTGFEVNSGEYKVMGLAPYGEPTYAVAILDEIVDLKPDGSYRLDLSFFDFAAGLKMTSRRFERLFGGPARAPDGPITRREMDLARSIQEVTEEIMVRQARHAREVTGSRNLCMAGGVALNCVGNGRVLREGIFDRIWIQPAAGDAGGALGAALAVWHGREGGARPPLAGRDRQKGSLLGPEFSDGEISAFLEGVGARPERLSDDDLVERDADLLAEGRVVGWFQGRMEFGPRALGNRSILGDPRSETMQSTMNLKIKFRESFRPFAPSVLLERCGDYFDLDVESPYMLLVAPVREEILRPLGDAEASLDGLDELRVPRSSIPAVTHVDCSARIQTVDREDNPLYRALVEAFERRTGCGLLVNTSFNVRGEPIVCTPADAYACFERTGMDALALGPFLIQKADRGGTTWERSRSPGSSGAS